MVEALGLPVLESVDRCVALSGNASGVSSYAFLAAVARASLLVGFFARIQHSVLPTTLCLYRVAFLQATNLSAKPCSTALMIL